jgi:beta-1,4-mannosyl-glycoprotein beta-1,4-N-acetylglucosaminyltransferase
MIYDCFPFFNELELLELRLHELAGVVDKFVLVEATRTHMNKPKPLFFHEGRARFVDFSDKIIHIVVRDLPEDSNPWVLDRFQRNCIARGLNNCRPDDWLLVSDVDEIPRAALVQKISEQVQFADNFLTNKVHEALNSKPLQSVLQRRGVRRLWRKHNPFVLRFQQVLYRYLLNCRSSLNWYGTRMARFRDFAGAEELRYSGYKTVPDAGWHFTWMGGTDRMREKMAAIAHQELSKYQNDGQLLELAIKEGKSLFSQEEALEFVRLDDTFPTYIQKHPEKFSGWLKLGRGLINAQPQPD